MDLVAETFGHYLIDPQGGVVPAYYSKSCGGHSEPPEAIFGFPVPGLVGVPDAPTAVDTRELKSWITGENGACYCSEVTVPRPLLPRYLGAVDETRAYFRWEYSIPEGELVENLRKKLDAPEISSVIDLLPTARGASGRITSAVLSLRMSDGSREDVAIAAQYDLRRLLHPSFLLSSAFLHRWEGEGSSRTLHLQGAGWGHGVGLCQIGGVGMAITGKNWKEILRHYFPSSELRMEYPKS
jgi:peptidoglycan hydrolase-like amidase